MKKKILCVVGTRPEAIKMAPVILALQRQDWAEVKVLATAQHRQMLDQVLAFFNIQADIDLDIMRPNQSLTTLTGRILLEMDTVLNAERPDVVLVQGDTTTVMTVSLACFYHRIAIGHVEAGLRTWDSYNPFPEEMNRVLTGRLAHWHFAPTLSSAANLRKEGIPEADISVTGNTVIDALLMTAEKDYDLDAVLAQALPADKRMVLVTCHRRENFGAPLQAICQSLLALAQANPEVHFLFPVHPNPNVKQVVEQTLSAQANIQLCAPLDYAPFIAAMKRAYLIISDSGGVQEEAPALAKPVLVLREETERPEAVECGVVKLVGADRTKIMAEVQRLLDDADYYQSLARGVSPYGDGLAAARIVEVLQRDLIGQQRQQGSGKLPGQVIAAPPLQAA